MDLRKIFLTALLICVISHLVFSQSATVKKEEYRCLPCGQDCDQQVYQQGGTCAHCNMPLVKASSITFKNIPPEKICKYIADHPEAILLDVRTREEFQGHHDPDFGTLKNAINIPVQELETRLSEIKSFRDKEIIVFCSHSHRSPRASYLLTQNGFAKVANMSGGMSVLKDNSCKK